MSLILSFCIRPLDATPRHLSTLGSQSVALSVVALMERKASPTSVTTAVATAEDVTNFPIGGYTLVCCGEQLLCFGGWVPGAPGKPPAARPQTAPAGRSSVSGGVQRASNALHAFHLRE